MLYFACKGPELTGVRRKNGDHFGWGKVLGKF